MSKAMEEKTERELGLGALTAGLNYWLSEARRYSALSQNAMDNARKYLEQMDIFQKKLPIIED